MKKYNSEVSYALYVQNNIKKDDYARLNIGKIVKVTGIRENNVNKKAIYYGIYDNDWFDCMAVRNFSTNLIDLIEVGDIVETEDKFGNIDCHYIYEKELIRAIIDDVALGEYKILSILTHEQYEQNCYKKEE